ncbi:MAG TPA: hypothetical protein VM659_22745 [Dongiaceae bacterium]|nr:hypothetical protein [Dongiaceae bacterium]
MTILRYPLSALLGDYAIGLSGTAICVVMLVTASWSSKLIWLFLGLTLCCLAYTIRTALQHRTVFQVDDRGIARVLMGNTRRIDWDGLQGMSLRYYARRRAKKKGMGSVLGRIGRRSFDERPASEERPSAPLQEGWLVLKLRNAAKQSIVLESGLPDFFALAERAARAAHENNVELDPVSDDNLRALASLPPEFRAPSGQASGISSFRRNS